MRMEILQEFKGVIGETEFEREDIYDVVYQLIKNTDLEEKLEKLSKEDVEAFVRNAKKVFEMIEYSGLDIYDGLDSLQNDIEEEKEVLGESLEYFWQVKLKKINKTEEFKKMNEIYKKTLKL